VGLVHLLAHYEYAVDQNWYSTTAGVSAADSTVDRDQYAYDASGNLLSDVNLSPGDSGGKFKGDKFIY